MTQICRVCGSSKARELISFGLQPNSMQLLDSYDQEYYEHDLTLKTCLNCGFTFISNPMPANFLYADFHWGTSTYPPSHLEELCHKISHEFLQTKNDLIMEIGSNDGYFLSLFRERNCNNLLGVEPTKNCVQLSLERGVPTLNAFFGKQTADEIVATHGKATCIICRHVLEHVWELEDFLNGVSRLMLDDDSVFVLEVPDFDTIVAQGNFSSIWEQHVNYFNILSIDRLLRRHNFDIFAKEIVQFAGNSIMLFAKKTSRQGTDINNILDTDNLAKSKEIFKQKIERNILELNDFFSRLKYLGFTIAAYGAGMRGVCLVNFSGIYKYIDYFIDDDLRKVGKVVPKCMLEIRSPEVLYRERPEYCLITPLKDKATEKQLQKNHYDYSNNGGTFIELFPEKSPNCIIMESNPR